MSLLPTTNSGSASLPYFIENVGGAGVSPADAPCIKGTPLGTVRVGNPVNGLVLRGDPGGLTNFVRGGAVAGSTLNLGSSGTSFSNIVLTDALTTVNTTLAITGAGADLSVADAITLGGDLTFTNGATGSSITGIYSAGVFVNVAGAGTFPLGNPAGITPGWYMIAVAQPVGVASGARMPGCVGFYNSAGLWNIGGFGGDTSTFYIAPTDDHTSLQIVSADARPSTTVVFAKMAN